MIWIYNAPFFCGDTAATLLSMRRYVAGATPKYDVARQGRTFFVIGDGAEAAAKSTQKILGGTLRGVE